MTLVGGVAFAQQQLGPVSGGVLVQSIPSLSPENGLLLSDSALMHVGVTVEGGYDSNVFYDDTPGNNFASSLLRINPFVEISNTARNGEVPSGLYFEARAALTYREYLSSDKDINALRSFTPQIGGSLEHNANGMLAFGLMESFARLQDPPFNHAAAASGMLIRDNNQASAQLRWTPGGGRLQGLLRLTDVIDYFELASLKAASSISNELMLDVSWRWLPKTALFFQARQGYLFHLSDNSALASDNLRALSADGQKFSSYPLRLTLGIRGLITEKTSVALAVGYQNAFYSGGANTTDAGVLGSTLIAAELVVTPIFGAKITFGVRNEFRDSVLGNFYLDDGAYLNLAYQTTTRLIAQLWGSYDHKQYYNAPMVPGGRRNDDLIQAAAALDYYLKSWAFAGISYTLAMNHSDPDLQLSGAKYTKHQVFARVGISY